MFLEKTLDSSNPHPRSGFILYITTVLLVTVPNLVILVQPFARGEGAMLIMPVSARVGLGQR